MKKFFSGSIMIPILLIIVVSGILLWPLFRPGFFLSDDGEWMIIRLSAFFQTLREGQFPVRFITRLNDNYGYPVSNFLYPGYLYIGSILHGFGLSFVNSIKALFAVSVVTGGIAIYAWLRTYFSKTASLVGAISYLFSPYLLFDIYSRGSLGEVLALSVGAIGLYVIAARKTWAFPYVVAVLVLSHNTLGLICSAVLLTYIVSLRAKEFALPFILGIGISLFFWFPALYERRYVLFDSIAISNPTRHFVGYNQLWLYGISSGFAAVIAIQHSILKYQRMRKYALILFLLSLFLASPLSQIFWSNTMVNSFIQFPFRFLGISILIGAWITGYSIEVLEGRKKNFFILLFIFFWLIILVRQERSIVFVERPDGFYNFNEATTTVQDEYMPRWVSQKRDHRANQRIEFYSGSGQIVNQPSSSQHIEFDVNIHSQSVLQINTIYYPGWGALIDGQPVPVDFQNSYGLMRISVPVGEHRIVVEFRETVIRFLCNMISVVSVLVSVWFGYSIVQSKRRKSFS